MLYTVYLVVGFVVCAWVFGFALLVVGWVCGGSWFGGVYLLVVCCWVGVLVWVGCYWLSGCCDLVCVGCFVTGLLVVHGFRDVVRYFRCVLRAG